MVNKKFAVTLVEILLTIGIIGVVATLTIPTLVRNMQDAQCRTALKKTYAIIANATNKMQYDYGGLPWTAVAKQDGTETTNMFNVYNSYLNFTQTEYIGCAAYTGPLFAPAYSNYKSTSASTVAMNVNSYHCTARGGMLNDGVSLFFQSLPGGLGSTINGNVVYVEIRVDVNGPNPPNMFGRDYFYLLVLKNTEGVLSVVPAGIQGSPGRRYDNCLYWGANPYGYDGGCTYYAINDLPMP